MKNIILILFLVFFANGNLSGQDQALFIQDFNIVQTGENEIKANLKVYSPDLATFNANITEINDNIITLKVCYNAYFIPAISNLDNDFQINLPSTNGNFTLKVEVYRANSDVCGYLAPYLEDTASLDFTTPFTGVISLSTANIENKDKNIMLYPNPVKDFLYFSEEVSHVKIIDLSGKVVKQFSTSGKSIDVSTISKGNYLITITTKKGEMITKKLIKK